MQKAEILEVAVVFLINQGKIYISKRHPRQPLGGTYEPIQETMVESDRKNELNHLTERRAYYNCAQRGLEQELGITDAILEPVYFEEKLEVEPEKEIRLQAYIGRSKQTPNPNSRETIPTDSRYRTIAEIEEIIEMGEAHPALIHLFPKLKMILEARLR